MPIHDWTRVTAGTLHDFHLVWIGELRTALNGGVLPEGYYAQAEQVATGIIPDVLTLHEAVAPADAVRPAGDDGGEGFDGNGTAGVAVAAAPPRVALSDVLTEDMLTGRRRRVVIRHATGDRVVALLEIVSPGNKDKRSAFEQFVEKAAAALQGGYHLLVLDLFPPGPYDPHGMHGAVWDRLGGAYEPPAGKPLTLAAYAADRATAWAVTCYVEPTAVGAGLIDMPLFLDPDHYVNVPLEPTYLAAYKGVPGRWKRVIEGAPE